MMYEELTGDDRWEVPLRDQVQQLFLAFKDLKEAEMAKFCKTFKNNSSVMELYMEANEELGPAGAALLADCLRTNTRLVRLSLLLDNIGDAGAKSVANALRQNRTLTCLELGLNNITPVGAKSLAEALVVNPTLKTLDISENDIGNAGAKDIAKALYVNSALTELDLTYCDVTAEGLDAFGVALNKNTKLTSLKISDETTKLPDIVTQRLQRNERIRKKEFLNAMEGNEKGPWNRAKLMFIGQGRAGKTSTVRSLLGQEFEPELDSTVGASLTQTQTAAGELDKSRWNALDPNQVNYSEQVKARAALKQLEGGGATTNTPYVPYIAQEKFQDDDLDADFPVPVQQRTDAPKAARPKSVKKAKVPEAPVLPTINLDEIGNNVPDVVDEPEPETVKKFNQDFYAKASSSKDAITFSLWDYGGQNVFYSLHHLFLTRFGIYVLVFDMRELRDKPENAASYIKFWLNSVTLHAPDAPVIIVGTFLDQLADSAKQIQDLDKALGKILGDRYKQVVTNARENIRFHPVDNRNGTEATFLRSVIEQQSLKLPFVKQDVSLRWMGCLDEMLAPDDSEDKTKKGVQRDWLSLRQVKDIAKNIGMKDEKEVNDMLALFHELGVIVHLTQTEELKSVVTLQPQWLIDALCKVIRDKEYHPYDMAEIKKIGLEKDLGRLTNQALASRDILEYFWAATKAKDKVDFMLDLMRQMVLISDWEFSKEQLYVVPSLFEAEKEVKKKAQKGHTCILDFSEFFLPIGVFQRLVCLCVSHSSMIIKTKEKKQGGEPELHKDWAHIWLGEQTRVYIEQEGDEIRFVVDNDGMASSVYKAVIAMIKKLNDDLMANGLKYQVYFLENNTKIIRKDAEAKKLSPWFVEASSNDQGTVDQMKLDEFVLNLGGGK